jgi:CheY-like chemotaxis protein
LIARTRGTLVELSLKDDGGGIDPATVARVAERRGLIDLETAKSLSLERAIELLFRPGFSTSEKANLISGRGVGLHDVSKALDELRGSISVENSEGFPGGSRFTLRFPVSKLNTRGLLVRDGGQTYTLPLSDVERTLPAHSAAIETLDDSLLLRLDERTLVPLRPLLTLLGQTDGASASSLGNADVVLLRSGGQRLAVTVEEVLWDSPLVLKPLPWNLKNHPHTQGIALLPDGSYAIALDPRRFDPRGAVARSTGRASKTERRVLVVDDSLTRRTLHCNLMRSAGYEVESAPDGLQAWNLLQDLRFDMLVSDVQMPELDGIELVRRVRRDASLKNLPVVLVTGLSDPDGERRGLEAGANAWVRKQDFAHERLLETIAALFERSS